MWPLIIAAILATRSSDDLRFEAAVEEFAMSASRTGRPAAPFDRLIDDLGSDCWRFREASSRRLERACLATGEVRWLFWGRRYRDAEIRVRCNAILRRLTRCQLCMGIGFCPEFKPGNDNPDNCRQCHRNRWWHDIDNAPPCTSCRGSGAAWARTAFE
jgi:hypothetical protein